MSSDSRKYLLVYASVVALTLAALGCSKLLGPFIQPNYFLPFIAAELVSTCWFGRAGGGPAAVLATLVVGYVYIPGCLVDWHESIRLLTFTVVSVLIVQLTHEMRSSQQRSAAMLSSICDAVVVTDKQGNIVFVNEAATHLSGKSLEESRGLPLDQVYGLRNEEPGEPQSIAITDVLQQGVTVTAPRSGLYSQPDGQQISLEESIAPIRDDDGKVTGAVLLLRDVTQRRQVQDELTQSQKMDAIGRLAGGVAGDFNNLLTVITGYSEMLTAEMQSTNPLRRFAEEIFTAAEGMSPLLRSVAVGVVEILAGVLVAVRPSIGAYVVAAWLLGIIVNLVSIGGYYDVALRDFGLLVAALALARLAVPGPRVTGVRAPFPVASENHEAS